MKNPCSECLVQVNCTEICFDKTNYRRLIENTISQRRRINNHIYFKQSIFYNDMLNKTIRDEFEIKLRSNLLKNDI